jgi:hypothetical protein
LHFVFQLNSNKEDLKQLERSDLPLLGRENKNKWEEIAPILSYGLY